jgi:uncharacterized protein (TIGR02147 family)
MYAFSNDYAWLAKNVFPPITPKQAKRSVVLLEKIGLIKKRPDGIFEVADKTITTGEDIVSLAVQNLHLDLMQLTSQSLKSVPHGKRNISALILGISDKTFKRICEETGKFQSKILDLAENDTEADRVYDFNFYLLPVSKTEIDGRRK